MPTLFHQGNPEFVGIFAAGKGRFATNVARDSIINLDKLPLPILKEPENITAFLGEGRNKVCLYESSSRCGQYRKGGEEPTVSKRALDHIPLLDSEGILPRKRKRKN
jgi:hypothetical protein